MKISDCDKELGTRYLEDSEILTTEWIHDKQVRKVWNMTAHLKYIYPLKKVTYPYTFLLHAQQNISVGLQWKIRKFPNDFLDISVHGGKH